MKIFNFFHKFLKLFNFLHKKTIQKPKIQESIVIPEVVQKKEQKLHFIFVTRCYKVTNLQTIKDNLKSVFANQNNYTYEQILIADLSYKTPLYLFRSCEDQNTKLFFIKDKGKDKYMSEGIDNVLKNIERERAYVYILDDDNLISQNFLDICKEINYDEDDAIFFKVPGHDWTYKNIETTYIGTVDWASFITKLSVMKELKVFTEGTNSINCDGLFVEKLHNTHKKVKNINQIIGNYNVLHKP